MESVTIRGVVFGVEDTCEADADGRPVFEWSIVAPTGRWEGRDLRGPAAGREPSEAEMLATLLNFVGASLDSRAYRERSSRPRDPADTPESLFSVECLDALDGSGIDGDTLAGEAEMLSPERDPDGMVPEYYHRPMLVIDSPAAVEYVPVEGLGGGLEPETLEAVRTLAPGDPLPAPLARRILDLLGYDRVRSLVSLAAPGVWARWTRPGFTDSTEWTGPYQSESEALRALREDL